MKREQLLRLPHKQAKAENRTFRVDMARGKGGHCVAWCDAQFAVVKSGEITPMMERSSGSNLASTAIGGVDDVLFRKTGAG